MFRRMRKLLFIKDTAVNYKRKRCICLISTINNKRNCIFLGRLLIHRPFRNSYVPPMATEIVTVLLQNYVANTASTDLSGQQ